MAESLVVPEIVEPIARPELPKICIILVFGDNEEVITGFDLVFGSFEEAHEYFDDLRKKYREEIEELGEARRLAKEKPSKA